LRRGNLQANSEGEKRHEDSRKRRSGSAVGEATGGNNLLGIPVKGKLKKGGRTLGGREQKGKREILGEVIADLLLRVAGGRKEFGNLGRNCGWVDQSWDGNKSFSRRSSRERTRRPI